MVAVIVGACVSRLFVPERPGAVGIMLDALCASGVLALWFGTKALLRKKKTEPEGHGSADKSDAKEI